MIQTTQKQHFYIICKQPKHCVQKSDWDLMAGKILDLGQRFKIRHLTNGSCETVLLSLFVKHHFTARLLQYIFLCSLHEAKGAAPPLPHSVHLGCHLTVIHQWGHAQEARYHFQKHLREAKKITEVSWHKITSSIDTFH